MRSYSYGWHVLRLPYFICSTFRCSRKEIECVRTSRLLFSSREKCSLLWNGSQKTKTIPTAHVRAFNRLSPLWTGYTCCCSEKVVLGCRFHLGQAWMKHMKALGLAKTCVPSSVSHSCPLKKWSISSWKNSLFSSRLTTQISNYFPSTCTITTYATQLSFRQRYVS